MMEESSKQFNPPGFIWFLNAPDYAQLSELPPEKLVRIVIALSEMNKDLQAKREEWSDYVNLIIQSDPGNLPEMRYAST